MQSWSMTAIISRSVQQNHITRKTEIRQDVARWPAFWVKTATDSVPAVIIAVQISPQLCITESVVCITH